MPRRLPTLLLVVALAACGGSDASGPSGVAARDIIGLWDIAYSRVYLQPGDVNVVQTCCDGHAASFEFFANGTWEFALAPGFTNNGSWVLEGDSLYTTVGNPNDVSASAVEKVDGGLLVSSASAWDFDEDGVAEAAILRTLLVRR